MCCRTHPVTNGFPVPECCKIAETVSREFLGFMSGTSVQLYKIRRRIWQLTKADGPGVCQCVMQQAAHEVGAVVLGVVSGVVVYANEVERPLDKGSLIRCELGEPVPDP